MGLVKIDLGRLQASIMGAVPHKPDMHRVLQGLGAAARQKWVSLAQKNLGSTSRDYIAGIQLTVEDRVAVLELVGKLPNMLERGWPGGDMREWMLKSPKAKQGKNGPYLVVPFRHGAPGTSGRNTGAPMPTSIHQVAKQLAPTVSRPSAPGSPGGTKWGGRLHPGLPMSKKAKEHLTRKAKPFHTTSLHMGMVRKQKTYEKATQSSYQTFRTISQHSNAPGKHWVHPGIKPRRFARDVQKHVEHIAEAVIITALGGQTK